MTHQALEHQIGETLRRLGLTLAIAESCTGGLVCDRITNVPGSSDYFVAGIVSYSNQAKINLLGVRQETLENFGAVSAETVIEMADGVRSANHTDLGISISGIAGPGGGTPEKPVGTTWIGLSSVGYVKAERFQFQGSRQEIKNAAAQSALQMLLDHSGTGQVDDISNGTD